MEQEKIWDAIAKPWQEFREKPLVEVADFLKDKQGRILDLCCGSGRHFNLINGDIYGTDFSEKMLALANKQVQQVKIKAILKKADATKIPFEADFFDAAIYIAGLHCIESIAGRKKSLQELFRVLKPQAEALISVWSRKQKRIKNKPKEAYIPWTVNGKIYERYYHLYEKEELEEELRQIGFEIVSSKEFKNIFIIVKKPKSN